jgi:hypothetical protein
VHAPLLAFTWVLLGVTMAVISSALAIVSAVMGLMCLRGDVWIGPDANEAQKPEEAGTTQAMHDGSPSRPGDQGDGERIKTFLFHEHAPLASRSCAGFQHALPVRGAHRTVVGYGVRIRSAAPT